LIVDSSGLPIASEVFPGNIGKPKTLDDILKKMGYFEGYLPDMDSVLVIDRGRATKDNVKLLKDKKLRYILVTRGPRNASYLETFRHHSSDPEFKSIIRNNKEIKVKKVYNSDTGITEVLCFSEGKREKENAVRRRWTERASEDLASLQNSISKGTVKLTDKIWKKIGRPEELYARLNKYFSIDVIEDTLRSGYACELKFYGKLVFDIEKHDANPLNGIYVIETLLNDKSAEDIWSLYMTLTRVEKLLDV